MEVLPFGSGRTQENLEDEVLRAGPPRPALEQQHEPEGLPATEHQILGAQAQCVVGPLVLLELQVHKPQHAGLLLWGRGEEREGEEKEGIRKEGERESREERREEEERTERREGEG